MGYVHVTAEALGAVYDTSSNTLTLTAWGENNMYGIEFAEHVWKEENIIQFQFGGWTCPTPYEYPPPMDFEQKQKFPMKLTPNMQIVVFDPLREEGVLLDIQFLCEVECEKGGIPKRVVSRAMEMLACRGPTYTLKHQA